MKILKTANYQNRMKKKALLQMGTIVLLVDQVVEMVSEWGDELDAALSEVFEGQDVGPDVMRMVKEEVIKKIQEKGIDTGGVDTTPLDSDLDFTERGF